MRPMVSPEMLRKAGERFIVFFPPSNEGPVCGGIRRKTPSTENSCCVLWVRRLPAGRELISFYLRALGKLATFIILKSSATKNLSCKEQKGEVLDFTALHSVMICPRRLS